MTGEPGLRARDLRGPQEADGEAGPRNRAACDGPAQGARDLEDGGAARGVVVSTRRLMAEVRGEDHFPGRSVRARDGGRHHIEVRRLHLPAHESVEADPLARVQSVAILARLTLRQHERERVLRLVGREVPPAHEVGIVPRPRGGLVRKVGHETERAPFLHRELVHAGQGAAREHDASLHVPALVVLCGRARPDVDQIRGDVRVLAVVGEGHRQLRKARDWMRLRRDLIEPAFPPIPSEVATEVGVARGPVRRKVLDHRVRESGLERGVAYPLRRGQESRRSMHPMKPAERTDGLERGLPIDRRVDRLRHGVGPEGNAAFLGGDRGGGQGGGEGGTGNSHSKQGESPRYPGRETPRAYRNPRETCG